MKSLVIFSMILFLLFASSVRADAINEIWTANINGTSKRSFTTSEIVYAAGNISSVNYQILLCAVNDTNTWVNGSRINDTTGSCKAATTNSTGYFLQLVWSDPKAGSYDLVADVNQDGYYETDMDYIWNVTTTGFVVATASKPTLMVELGSNTPSSHSCNAANLTDCSNNVMMQLKLSADSYDDINFTSVSLVASGTGNDKTSIRRVSLVEDKNNTGKFAAGENIYADYKFFADNGTLILSFNGYKINKSTSSYFKITYDFVNGSAGDTYAFQVIAVSAKGITGGQIPTISGLPVSSATKTMTGATTTVATTTTTAAENLSTAVTTTINPAENMFSDYVWIILTAVVGGAAVATVYLVLKRKKKASTEQKRGQKKEEDLSAEDLLKGV
jgi:hypothetical protein